MVVNLYDIFDELNQTVFNNTIEKTELKWVKSKKNLGLATKHPHYKIEITDFYLYDIDVLKMIVCHEMVHIEQFQNNFKGNYHGKRFDERSKQIHDLKLLKYSIVDDILVEHLQINPRYAKLLTVLITTLHESNKDYITVFKHQPKNFIDDYLIGIKNSQKMDCSMKVYESSNADLLHFPVYKGFSSNFLIDPNISPAILSELTKLKAIAQLE